MNSTDREVPMRVQHVFRGSFTDKAGRKLYETDVAAFSEDEARQQLIGRFNGAITGAGYDLTPAYTFTMSRLPQPLEPARIGPPPDDFDLEKEMRDIIERESLERQRMLWVLRRLDQLDWVAGYELTEANMNILDDALTQAREILASHSAQPLERRCVRCGHAGHVDILGGRCVYYETNKIPCGCKCEFES